MTKEQAIERVEIAHKVYEILKQIPVNERHGMWHMVEQFGQQDWNEYHKAQRPLGYETCSPEIARN